MPPLSSAACSADSKTVQSSGDTACGPRPAAWFRRLSAEVLRNRLSSSSTRAKTPSAHSRDRPMIGARTAAVDHTHTPTSVFIARK